MKHFERPAGAADRHEVQREAAEHAHLGEMLTDADRVAVVALARRLAGIRYAMMRDGTEFDGNRFAPATDRLSATA